MAKKRTKARSIAFVETIKNLEIIYLSKKELMKIAFQRLYLQRLAILAFLVETVCSLLALMKELAFRSRFIFLKRVATAYPLTI